jgi:dTDP-4-amino-4,6-dideoxygalactose transaminase
MFETKKPIYVTKPYLPPLEELKPYLEQIWDTRVLTNNGPFLQQFEKNLSEYLHIPYITVVVNGTSALEIALECLGISGEVITTPYSFVATSQALLWKNIRPVFVDIESDFCTIDPGEIEKAITDNTTAILPVHVYGFPCKIDQIQAIADKYNLKIIYDAAHAFGVKYKGESITTYGDLSILSFHATKVFNTFEGGAIICHDAETKKSLDSLRDFGYFGDKDVVQRGINAKMNEFQAAVGILQLNYIDGIIDRLKKLHSLYSTKLINIHGLSVLGLPEETEWNYSYYPVFINENLYGCSTDVILTKLKNNGIHCRRYFYPLIYSLELFKNFTLQNENLQTAICKSEEVLCLPMYPDLTLEDINRIVYLLRQK